MIKAIIKGRVWLRVQDLSNIDPVFVHYIKNDCTIIPHNTSTFKQPDPIKVFMLSSDRQFVGIPRGYFLGTFRRKTQLAFDEDVQVSGGCPLRTTEVKFTPRPDDQAPIIEEFLSAMTSRPWNNGSIEAYTSFGKTTSSIEIIRRLNRTAIVFVHTTALLEQWKERVKQFCPDWKIGQIGDGKFFVEGCDVVVSTVQSLMLHPEKLPESLWSHFGVVCVDELHRYGAEKFSSAIPRFNAKYIFGMSGTLRRLDRTENVFRYLVGNTTVKASEKNRILPKIFVKDTKVWYPDHGGSTKADFLSYIESHEERNDMIAKDVVEAVKKGRTPLILSERLTSLRAVSFLVDHYLKQEGIQKTQGFFIGGKTKEERDLAASCDIIYATTQLAKEGIDIPKLDTLLSITPNSDNEQSIGRIVRKFPNKKEPLVVDYVDFEIPNFKFLFLSRLKLYRKNGWQVLGLPEGLR